jgi:Derlin-2/3
VPRGGSEEYSDEDFSGFELDDMSPDGSLDEADLVSRIKTIYQTTPPVTRAFTSLSALATLLGVAFHSNQFPPYLDASYPLTFFRLNLWRPLTAFFNLGPLGLGYLLTIQFLHTYMSQLERLSCQSPASFWLLITFGMSTMTAAYFFLGLPPRLLGHNLSTYLVYVWARTHEGMEVSLMDLVTVKAEFLPWFFMLQTFLLEGELPVLDLLGIAFGHLYFHLDHTGKLKPPGWVEGWYRESPSRAAVLLREEYVRRRGGAEGSGANAKRSIAKRANAKRANAKRTNAGRPREKRQKLSGGSAAHVRRVLGHTCVAHVLYRPHSRC